MFTYLYLYFILRLNFIWWCNFIDVVSCAGANRKTVWAVIATVKNQVRRHQRKPIRWYLLFALWKYVHSDSAARLFRPLKKLRVINYAIRLKPLTWTWRLQSVEKNLMDTAVRIISKREESQRYWQPTFQNASWSFVATTIAIKSRNECQSCIRVQLAMATWTLACFTGFFRKTKMSTSSLCSPSCL